MGEEKEGPKADVPGGDDWWEDWQEWERENNKACKFCIRGSFFTDTYSYSQ